MMELVYLWVEDYKNIQKQGFNFSPRFDCTFHDEYDENGKLKDNCKLDIQPKEHIENFFGDNINVTAIVGKNGSGKSTLLELLLEVIVRYKNSSTQIKDLHETKYILIWNNVYLTNIDSLNVTNYQNIKNNKFDFFTISIDYGLDTFKSEIYRSNKHYIYSNDKKYILEPNKFSQNKSNINLDIDNEKNRKRIISYQKKLKDKVSLRNKIFIPKKVVVKIDARRVPFKKADGKKDGKKGGYFNGVSSSDYADAIVLLNTIYINGHTKKYITDEEKEKANNVGGFIDNIKGISLEENILKLSNTANIKEQKGIMLEFKDLDDAFLENLGNLPRYFLLDFVSDNDTSYSDLSTGEKHLQKLIYTIIDYIYCN